MTQTPVLLDDLSRDPKFYTLGLIGACQCTKNVMKWLDAAVISAYLLGMKPLRIVVCADTPFGYEALRRVAEVRSVVSRTKVVALVTPGMWELRTRTIAERRKTRCTDLFAGVDEVFLLSEGEFEAVAAEKHRILARTCDLVVEAYPREAYRRLRDLRIRLQSARVPWYPLSGPAIRLVTLAAIYAEEAGGMKKLAALAGVEEE